MCMREREGERERTTTLPPPLKHPIVDSSGRPFPYIYYPTPTVTSCCGVRGEPVYHPTPSIQCLTSESSRRPNKLANCEVEVYRKVSYSSPHLDSEIISPWSPKGTPRQSEKPYRKSPIGDKFGVRLRRRIGIPNAVFFLAGVRHV